MKEFEYHGSHWGWWLLLIIVLLVAFFVGLIVWKKRRLAMLAIPSALLGLLIAAQLPLSWRNLQLGGISWHTVDANGWNRINNLGVVASNGGVQLGWRINIYRGDGDIDPEAPNPQIFFDAMLNVRSKYPIYNDRIAWFRESFLENWGFEVRSISNPWNPILDEEYRMNFGITKKSFESSITLPQWFVIALTLIFPLWWFKRFIKKRRRRSGFPISAIPVPTPPASAATPTPTSGAEPPRA